MKKILSISLICILVSVFCSTATSTAKTNDADVDFLLIPYNKVLTKLSDEYGVGMYVPEKNKEKFLTNIKEMTPKEFEKLLRKQYKESQKYINKFSHDKGEYKSLNPQYIPNADNVIPANPVN